MIKAAMAIRLPRIDGFALISARALKANNGPICAQINVALITNARIAQMLNDLVLTAAL